MTDRDLNENWDENIKVISTLAEYMEDIESLIKKVKNQQQLDHSYNEKTIKKIDAKVKLFLSSVYSEGEAIDKLKLVNYWGKKKSLAAGSYTTQYSGIKKGMRPRFVSRPIYPSYQEILNALNDRLDGLEVIMENIKKMGLQNEKTEITSERNIEVSKTPKFSFLRREKKTKK